MSKFEYAPLRTINNIPVYLEPDNFLFVVEFPSNDGNPKPEAFQSMADAHLAIMSYLSTKAKQEKTKFHATMITDDGEKVNVRGIHATTSRLLGVKDDVIRVYPNVPYILHLIKTRNTMAQLLEEVQILVRRGFGRINSESYDGYIAKLEIEYTSALAKAVERQKEMNVPMETQNGKT